MTTTFRQLRRAAVVAMFGLVALARTAGAQTPLSETVAVDARPDKSVYQLGDPVSLDVRVVNRSAGPLAIPAALDVWVGNVEVFIAAGGSGFVRYTGPGWGLRDLMLSGTRTLGQGQSWTTEAAILYNHGLKTDHLSPAARREASDRIPDSGFAFRSAGVYRLKVVVHGPGFTDAVESNVVQIAVTEPRGNDRAVWNVLKSDPDVAYFLHTGGPKGHPLAAKGQAIAGMLQQLAAAHPSSRYAVAIEDRLASFESTVARLRDRGLVAP